MLTYPPSHLAAEKSFTYPPSHLAAEKETFTYPPNPSVAEKENTYLSLAEFHQAQCFKRPEVTRFLKELAEEARKNLPAAAKAPAFLTVRPAAGCVRCGKDADHDTDGCRKIASMDVLAWKTFVGDGCIRCGMHPYKKGVRCTHACTKCGEAHLTARHGQWVKRPRDAGKKQGPGPKKARREGPPAAPGAYHSNAYPPPPPHYGPPPPAPPQYGPPAPGYPGYQPSREAPPQGPPAGPSAPRSEQEIFEAGRKAEKAAQKKRQAKKKGKNPGQKAIKIEKPEKTGQ
jgi:hypothetical protein